MALDVKYRQFCLGEQPPKSSIQFELTCMIILRFADIDPGVVVPINNDSRSNNKHFVRISQILKMVSKSNIDREFNNQ